MHCCCTCRKVGNNIESARTPVLLLVRRDILTAPRMVYATHAISLPVELSGGVFTFGLLTSRLSHICKVRTAPFPCAIKNAVVFLRPDSHLVPVSYTMLTNAGALCCHGDRTTMVRHLSSRTLTLHHRFRKLKRGCSENPRFRHSTCSSSNINSTGARS